MGIPTVTAAVELSLVVFFRFPVFLGRTVEAWDRTVGIGGVGTTAHSVVLPSRSFTVLVLLAGPGPVGVATGATGTGGNTSSGAHFSPLALLDFFFSTFSVDLKKS